MIKKKIAILGSTGSIGKSSLNVISLNKNKFNIILLSCNSNYKEIKNQIKTYRPKSVKLTTFVFTVDPTGVFFKKAFHGFSKVCL